MNEKNENKVLVIAYVFPPIAYAGTFRTLRLCRYLPRSGWIPHVLTIKISNDLENDYSLLELLPTQVKIYRTNTVDFWRYWKSRAKKKVASNFEKTMDTKKPNQKNKINIKKLKERLKNTFWFFVTTPDHMIFWVPFGIVKGMRILLREKFKIIYSSSPPHSEHIIGLILSKIFKKEWIVDFRDPWTNHFNYKAGLIKSKVDKFLEEIIVKNASAVLNVSKYYNHLLVDKYPCIKNKAFVFPNGYDPELYKNKPKDRFKKFTIVYSGSFYGSIKPDFFVKSIKKWIEKKGNNIEEQIEVLFFGLENKFVKKLVCSENLDNVIKFKGIIPKKMITDIIRSSHILLLIIGLDDKSKGIITSKVYDYIAAKRPILAIIPEGECADLLRSIGYKYIITQEDQTRIIEILEIEFNKFIRSKYSDEFEKLNLDIVKYYNAEYQTHRISNLFNSLTK